MPDKEAKSRAQKKWADKHRGELAQYQRDLRASGQEAPRATPISPKMKTAHKRVENAVNSGEMKKPATCSNCGKRAPLQAHHSTYGKGQDKKVRWLCSSCHRDIPSKR